ncbi:MarR family transcriptional regulator [Streptomyces sp. 8P21H-1]|uniref:MarR family transcriptional regulator n=1 Tax=Streptomyces sp. 8P21H-1 TaxID=2737048 RepID=UPI001C2D936B|nr:MarR family transcriptional regulator [Streptomyces sp. 8P21H-1]
MDPLTSDWTPDQIEVMHRLRDWAVVFIELNQYLASWTGLSSSDAFALSRIVWAAETDTPLSPAQLSRQIGMTSGATTVLLNRLETAGHIHRSRETATAGASPCAPPRRPVNRPAAFSPSPASRSRRPCARPIPANSAVPRSFSHA